MFLFYVMQTIYKQDDICDYFDIFNKNRKNVLIIIEFLCKQLYNYLILQEWGFEIEFTGNKKH